MKTSRFIARRYFFSKGNPNFINILTGISMIAVAFASMAMVIALSAFNGLESFTRSLHASHNPELRIKPMKGKVFSAEEPWIDSLKQWNEIEVLTEVLEDNALIRYGESQIVVRLKGVSSNFLEQYPLEDKLLIGDAVLSKEGQDFALLGAGVQIQLSLPVYESNIVPLVVWYPGKSTKVVQDPLKSFIQRPIYPSGVVSVDQQIDSKYVWVPIEFCQELMSFEDQYSSLELKLKEGVSLSKVQKKLKDQIGHSFLVENSEEQQRVILRAFKLERFFAFITFAFITGLSSLNLFFSLIMLSVEKKKDMKVLRSLGASSSLIRSIFLAEGMMISLSGTIIGLGVGSLLCYLQQKFHWVGIGAEDVLIDAYPVELQWGDLGMVLIVVCVISFIISLIPAQKASKWSL